MKTEVARRMLEAAREEATKMGKPVSVVVVDSAGVPVILERIMDAPPFTTIVADGKASASALMGRDSVMLQAMAQNFPAMAMSMAQRTGGRFMAVQGAVALLDSEGNGVGAIGVSGATAEEDEQIAKAGAARLEG